MTDTKGVHRKYNVTRTDGSTRHEECAFFVLDLDCDEHAITALKAYAKAVKKANPELAADLQTIIDHEPMRCGCREASCPHSLARALSPDGHGGMAHYLMDHASKR